MEQASSPSPKRRLRGKRGIAEIADGAPAPSPKKRLRRVTSPLFPGVGSRNAAWAASLTTYLQGRVRSDASPPWAQKRAVALIRAATSLLKQQETLVRLDLPSTASLVIVGDLHGQFDDLVRLLHLHGPPSENQHYLFNGDFVDRGPNSVEVLLVLMAWKVAAPASVHINRGNHEDHVLNSSHGFWTEVMSKFGLGIYNEFQASFRHMPIAHVINNRVFVVHGGLPRNMAPLEEVAKIVRAEDPIEPPSIMHDLLWSDPHDEVDQFGPNDQRGGDGVVFGAAATREYLEANGLSLLVRSHQRRDMGFDAQHDGLCVTVFSAANYGGSGNEAATLILCGQDVPVVEGTLLREAGSLGGGLGSLVARVLPAESPDFNVTALFGASEKMQRPSVALPLDGSSDVTCDIQQENLDSNQDSELKAERTPEREPDLSFDWEDETLGTPEKTWGDTVSLESFFQEEDSAPADMPEKIKRRRRLTQAKKLRRKSVSVMQKGASDVGTCPADKAIVSEDDTQEGTDVTGEDQEQAQVSEDVACVKTVAWEEEFTRIAGWLDSQFPLADVVSAAA